MLTEAIEKIKAEIKSGKTNYVLFCGQFLLNHLDKNPQDAEKILAADKSIEKSLPFLRQEAEKNKTGNFAMLTPDEGLSAVLNYFGIGEPDASAAQPKPKSRKDSSTKAAAAKTPQPVETEEADGADPDEDDIDFDALLM